jgi:FtsH-binding integral membrane protein
MAEFIPEKTKQEKVNVAHSGATFSMFKVLAWLGVGLLITAVVSLCLPDILIAACGDNADLLSNVYSWLIIISAILMIPSFIIVQIKASRKDSVLSPICYVIYTLCFGVLLSTVMLTVLSIAQADAIKLISIAFFVTAGCFLLMGILGAVIKSKLNMLWPFVITLCVGILVLSLVNFFMQSALIYWITDFVCFGLILIVTAIDMGNVKTLAENGTFESSTNMAIFCAYNLYVDFIYLFLRIMVYVLLIANRNK